MIPYLLLAHHLLLLGLCHPSAAQPPPLLDLERLSIRSVAPCRRRHPGLKSTLKCNLTETHDLKRAAGPSATGCRFVAAVRLTCCSALWLCCLSACLPACLPVSSCVSLHLPGADHGSSHACPGQTSAHRCLSLLKRLLCWALRPFRVCPTSPGKAAVPVCFCDSGSDSIFHFFFGHGNLMSATARRAGNARGSCPPWSGTHPVMPSLCP
ncbi:hypothetical protein BKA81DRAFT_43325 [Phyllosticta paracitricarpa]|uniref:Secreted protein n=2 Tax=Phyllosticta TaxID=121621 RepID=A0ABR1ML70_9PEZI